MDALDSIQYYAIPNGKLLAKEWLSSLKDGLSQAILYKRILQVRRGQFGKIRNIGDGISELKIDYGPGFRIYYGIHEDKLIRLCCMNHLGEELPLTSI